MYISIFLYKVIKHANNLKDKLTTKTIDVHRFEIFKKSVHFRIKIFKLVIYRDPSNEPRLLKLKARFLSNQKAYIRFS